MSEEQDSLASLTGSTDSYDAIADPKPEDVELVNQIVRRAQQEPLNNDRDRLDAAYRAVAEEHSLDIKRNNVCLRLIDEILEPGLSGITLYEKFENVMQKRGIELVPDDASIKDATQPPNGDLFQRHQPHAEVAIARSSSRPGSSASPTGTIEQADDRSIMWAELDHSLDHPPAYIEQLMQRARLIDKRVLFNTSLEQFRDNVPPRNLQAMEHQADAMFKFKLGFKVLTHWYNVQQQIVEGTAKAEDFFKEHYKMRTVSKLSRLMDSARVRRMHAMEDERLKGMGLYKMTIASREVAFSQTLDIRLKHKTLRHMIYSLQDSRQRTQELDMRLAQAQQRWCANAMGSVLVKMVNQCHHTQDLAVEADGRRDSVDKSRSLRKWYAQTEQVVQKQALLKREHDLSVLSKYFARLRAQHARRKALCKWAFARWRQRVRINEEERFALKKQELENKRRTFRREYKMRLAIRCLRGLQTRVEELAQLQQKADERSTAKLNKVAHGKVVMWYHQSHHAKSEYAKAISHANEWRLIRIFEKLSKEQHRVLLLKNKARDFDEIHVQAASAKYLKDMKREVFELRSQQWRLGNFQNDRNKAIMRSYLNNWHSKVADSRGEGPLILPPVTPAQRRADQLNRLASTTPLMDPRISFVARLRGPSRTIPDIEIDDADGLH